MLLLFSFIVKGVTFARFSISLNTEDEKESVPLWDDTWRPNCLHPGSFRELM